MLGKKRFRTGWHCGNLVWNSWARWCYRGTLYSSAPFGIAIMVMGSLGVTLGRKAISHYPAAQRAIYWLIFALLPSSCAFLHNSTVCSGGKFQFGNCSSRLGDRDGQNGTTRSSGAKKGRRIPRQKVRRTLAFSLHELAAILGPEVAVKDLLPVFTSFLRDLDEVRIGVLKHLYQFLKVCTLLDKEVRRQLLQHLADFMQTDNTRNWRFRLLLAEQLINLCDLYNAEDVNEYLSPIGMTLAIDKVADIRLKAHKLLATIMKQFFHTETHNGGSTMDLTDSFILDIIKGFGNSQRFMRRQSFAYICGEVMSWEAISEEKFVSELLPAYLSLADDPIPNVRIAFARSLGLDFFRKERTVDELRGILKRMSQNDPDKDVVILCSPTPLRHRFSIGYPGLGRQHPDCFRGLGTCIY